MFNGRFRSRSPGHRRNFFRPKLYAYELVYQGFAIALRHLREEREIVKIWIDAIRINQGDPDEKSVQVIQMMEIYEKSKKVVIWLGEAAEDSSYAMACIHRIDRRLASMSLRLENNYRIAAQAFDNRALRAIYRLLQRPWWSRAWIIQEAICANETYLRCGRDTTDFTAVAATANCLGYVTIQPSLQGHNAPDIQHLHTIMALDQLKSNRGRANYRSDLLGLLDNFRTCQASDPRDKIFALAALATGKEKEAASPDYSISVDKA